MILKHIGIVFVLVLLYVGKLFAQEDFGSHIKLARNADLIIIGEVVSTSTNTFNLPPSFSTYDPEVYQAVVFRVEKVIKGKYSSDFVRTMIGFDAKFTQLPFPESLEIKNGRKYILLLKTKVKPDKCKNLSEENFNNLECYRVSNNALIVALKEEIEAI